MMYLHSWEFDPGQPRVPGAGPTRAARHYVNLSRTAPRMRQLIAMLQRRDARFMTASGFVDTLARCVTAMAQGQRVLAERPAARRPAGRTACDGTPGRTIAVPSGGDLQAALARARPGDVVTLAPGAVYRGPFTLPKKDGFGWIVIRTAGDQGLAPPGTRIDPGQARAMARLVASSGSVVRTAPGAHHYRLIGLEIRPAEGVFLYNLVEIGRPRRRSTWCRTT